MKYLVWDELNSDEECADAFEAYCPEYAAEEYADEDSDGLMDGIYDNGHPIIVKCPSGEKYRFTICVEAVPNFYATKKEKIL